MGPNAVTAATDPEAAERDGGTAATGSAVGMDNAATVGGTTTVGDTAAMGDATLEGITTAGAVATATNYPPPSAADPESELEAETGTATEGTGALATTAGRDTTAMTRSQPPPLTEEVLQAWAAFEWGAEWGKAAQPPAATPTRLEKGKLSQAATPLRLAPTPPWVMTQPPTPRAPGSTQLPGVAVLSEAARPLQVMQSPWAPPPLRERMPLREAFPRGEVPLRKEAEPPGGIQLLEEKLSFREAQLQEVVALWKEITRPRETLPPREIEPPREVEPPREIEPLREIGPPRRTWPPEGSTPPEGSKPLRGTASHQGVKPPGKSGPPGEVELSGRAVPPRGPLSAGGVAQQGELGQPKGVLPPELEGPVEEMSQPTTAPQPVEETQRGRGSTLLEPPPPQAGEGRQPSPPPLLRLT